MFFCACAGVLVQKRSNKTLTHHRTGAQGFLYDSDAYDDDLPRFHDSGREQPHVILPYSLDTNDMRYQLAAAGFPTTTQFTEYCCDAFDWL